MRRPAGRHPAGRHVINAAPVAEGTVLWEPTAVVRARAEITRYLAWLRETRGLVFDSYDALWRWSVRDIAAFWESLWDFFEVRGARVPGAVLERGRGAEGARWFPGATLNFAERALRHRGGAPAVLAYSETRPPRTLTRDDLRRDVAAAAAGLRRLGVRRGDRVAAYLPNGPEAAVALLASAGLGAIWSSCPPATATGTTAAATIAWTRCARSPRRSLRWRPWSSSRISTSGRISPDCTTRGRGPT